MADGWRRLRRRLVEHLAAHPRLQRALHLHELVQSRPGGGPAHLGGLVGRPLLLLQPRLVRTLALDVSLQGGAEVVLAEGQQFALRLALGSALHIAEKGARTSTIRWISGTPPPPHAASVQLPSAQTLVSARSFASIPRAHSSCCSRTTMPVASDAPNTSSTTGCIAAHGGHQCSPPSALDVMITNTVGGAEASAARRPGRLASVLLCGGAHSVSMRGILGVWVEEHACIVACWRLVMGVARRGALAMLARPCADTGPAARAAR